MGMISEAKKWKRRIEQKLGSALVVQRSRYHHFEAFLEIYKIGMVSEEKKWKLQIQKIRVGFGRTEVSILPF